MPTSNKYGLSLISRATTILDNRAEAGETISPDSVAGLLGELAKQDAKAGRISDITDALIEARPQLLETKWKYQDKFIEAIKTVALEIRQTESNYREVGNCGILKLDTGKNFLPEKLLNIAKFVDTVLTFSHDDEFKGWDDNQMLAVASSLYANFLARTSLPVDSLIGIHNDLTGALSSMLQQSRDLNSTKH